MTRPPTDSRRRLTRSADFDAVHRQGRSSASRHLVVYAFARPPGAAGEAGRRLGISVSRKVGSAVVRNRVKRQLREAFLRAEQALPDATDYVVIARPGLAEAVEERGFDWLVDELTGVAVPAGSPGA